MSSRFSAAKPKRAGESYARAHHGAADDDGPSKKVKFDVRNPSALAPDAREDDDVLDADVIGAGARGATKRGAVNIDGYDSDSDDEAFNARAEARGAKGKGKNGEEDVNLADQLDNYDARLKGKDSSLGDDEDDDMFAMGAADDAEDSGRSDQAKSANKSADRKAVRFLDQKDIEGQDKSSKSGGRVTLDDDESSDEEEVELAIQEEGVDEEVGAGGLKKHAPRIDAFNMRQENEEGAFDESGNFVRKAVDPDAVHDRWMEGVDKKEIKKAAAAHERREEDMRRQRKEDDSVITSDLLESLIIRLEKGETALETLARLGKGQAKSKPKKIPKWKQKKQKQGANGMDLDTEATAKDTGEDARDTKIKETINAITEAADRLLKRDYAEIYDTEREMLVREYQKETGEAWVEPPKPQEKSAENSVASMWEYRWVDGRDNGAQQGPYDGPTMKAWQDAGYFSEGVEFRAVGVNGTWSRIVSFV